MFDLVRGCIGNTTFVFAVLSSINSKIAIFVTMKNGKVFLLLNGETPVKTPELNDYEIICATDGAYHFLKEKGITPDFISGDFDTHFVAKHFNPSLLKEPSQDELEVAAWFATNFYNESQHSRSLETQVSKSKWKQNRL